MPTKIIVNKNASLRIEGDIEIYDAPSATPGARQSAQSPTRLAGNTSTRCGW